MEIGEVGILNVGAGHIKLSFDPNDSMERLRAARIVKDMLQRGYVLAIEVERDGGQSFERVLEFREDTCEYIIADYDPTGATDAGDQPKPKRGGRRAVRAETTRAIGVARSAGG